MEPCTLTLGAYSNALEMAFEANLILFVWASVLALMRGRLTQYSETADRFDQGAALAEESIAREELRRTITFLDEIAGLALGRRTCLGCPLGDCPLRDVATWRSEVTALWLAAAYRLAGFLYIARVHAVDGRCGMVGDQMGAQAGEPARGGPDRRGWRFRGICWNAYRSGWERKYMAERKVGLARFSPPRCGSLRRVSHPVKPRFGQLTPEFHCPKSRIRVSTAMQIRPITATQACASLTTARRTPLRRRNDRQGAGPH